MEERVGSLENDYLAFVADVSTQLTNQTSMIRQLVRDNQESRMRLATIETRLASIDLRQNGMDEKLDEMREDMTAIKTEQAAQRAEMRQGFAQIIAMLVQQE